MQTAELTGSTSGFNKNVNILLTQYRKVTNIYKIKGLYNIYIINS